MNEFELTENKLLGITCDRFGTIKDSFDTKAKVNSEMAYCTDVCFLLENR